MSKAIRLSKDVTLPLQLATNVTLVAGKRGSGKTSTAKRIVEQTVRNGVPVAIIDPADVHWGLRAGRDGRADGGLPIHVFGGRHGDLPLSPGSGALLADVLVEQRISMVLAIREFSGAERARFITDFADRLIRKNTDPLLVVAEEAHEVMPQGKTMGQESVSLGAMLRLVTLGRSSGIGLLQVTQRLARLNKTATTQSDVLIVHRTIGPQDRDALEDWIKYHHGGSFRAQFMERLPELKTGEAWLWAPDFPEDAPIGLKLIGVLECETFNSHATPKVGETRQQPKSLAAVDLEKLRTKMADTIERAKQDDPKALRAELAAQRKRVADLEQQLQRAQNAKPEGKTKTVEKPVLRDSDIAAFDRMLAKIDTEIGEFKALVAKLDEPASKLREAARIARATTPTNIPTRPAPAPQRAAVPRPAPAPRATNGHAPAAGTALPKGERIILIAIAQHGEDGVTREQLTVLTEYKRSTRDAYLQRLGEKGLTGHHVDGAICATEDGVAALGSDYEPLPTGDQLRAYWLQPGKLPEGERRILEIVCAHDGVDRDGIGEATGFKRSTRDAYLQRLTSRKLVNSDRGVVLPSPTLFD